MYYNIINLVGNRGNRKKCFWFWWRGGKRKRRRI